ncbi:MAG: peptidase M16 [Kordiimonadales bacterium]|nr:MAG: peptidase M16 [Kordiimonadales bacterium]
MKLRHMTAIGSALLLASCGEEQTSKDAGQQPEKMAEASTGFSLDYEKFTLENGLEVILHVDRSDPIVAFTTVVHAGSHREKPGRTGFAHFFEHMAFNDSENVPRGWNRKAIPDWGGQRNGGTWKDGTIYYEVVPKDAFDKIMWIDSDRLGYMINTVTQEALEREKQVVKNEKRQRVDNAPYGYTGEVVSGNLYPKDHPYHWSVIGSLPDLQAATLADLKEFYGEFYGAGNATLAIVGDIDIAETKRKVQQWFGEIRKGPDVKPLPAMPVTLTETQSLYFEDNFAKLPELRIIFPSVESYHADEEALNVLAQIIAGSKNSPLYKQIVEVEKLAPNVGSFNRSQELAGEFIFRVRANAGIDLDAVKAALDTALANFEANGVDQNDLARIKAEQETILYSNFSTILGKANEMAQANEFSGDPAYAIKSAKQIAAITTEDVMAVYNKYIKGKASIVTSFVPKGQTELSVEGATLASVWIEEVKADVASEEVTQGALAEYVKTPSKYDRSEPPFSDLPLVKMPAIWEAPLANGIALLGIENSETPLVNFDVTIEGGGNSDVLSKKGVSSLLARLMNEGTAKRTAAELEQAIGLLGSGIRVRSNAEELVINVTTLSKNFEATVALVEEIIGTPRFEQSDFDRVKSATLTSIKGREANPRAIAALAFQKLIYSDQHPSGYAGSGTSNTVPNIELADMQAAHSALLGSKVRMHIAGDIKEDRAVAAMQSLAASFGAADTKAPSYSVPAQTKAGRVFFIDVPGSKQSVIYVGKLAVATTHEDANKINFTNEKLGGGISGDLAQVLRIEKGYTYGAYSRITRGTTAQPFSASTSVRANATQASLEVIRDMIATHGTDFTDADVETVRQKLVKENTRAFESLGAKLRTLNTISKYGKSKKYVESDQQELLAMPLADYKRITTQYLAEGEMLYLIVGDKESQFDLVKSFADGKLTELDIYGNPVSE